MHNLILLQNWLINDYKFFILQNHISYLHRRTLRRKVRKAANIAEIDRDRVERLGNKFIARHKFSGNSSKSIILILDFILFIGWDMG